MAPQGSDTRRVPEQCARCRAAFRIEKDIFSGELAGSVLAPEIRSHGPIDPQGAEFAFEPYPAMGPWDRIFAADDPSQLHCLPRISRRDQDRIPYK